jgi:predicted lipoprotein with Yx(FWY)xxD motif
MSTLGIHARPITVATMLATAMVLTACGATEESGTTGNTGDTTVRTADHPDIGTILVDTAGKTLYFTDQEEDGGVRCVDDCLEIWIPAESPDSTEPTGVDGLGVMKRADNSRQQLTYEGKPLYTFQLDRAAGDANGNAVEDDFGGTHFVWHAVTVGGQPAPNTGAGGGGYEGGY